MNKEYYKMDDTVTLLGGLTLKVNPLNEFMFKKYSKKVAIEYFYDLMQRATVFKIKQPVDITDHKVWESIYNMLINTKGEKEVWDQLKNADILIDALSFGRSPDFNEPYHMFVI